MSRVGRDKMNRARIARETAGLSIEQAAKLLGVTVDVLANVEDIDPAHADFDFNWMADVYHVRVEWLIGEVPRCDYAAIDRVENSDKLTFHDRDVLAEFASAMPRRTARKPTCPSCGAEYLTENELNEHLSVFAGRPHGARRK